MLSLLSGLNDIQQLSAEKQQAFERFYLSHVNNKLRPIFADLSLLSVLVGALFYISTVALKGSGISGVHPLNYVYCGLLFSLGLVHRLPRVRQASPLMVYLIFSTVSLFSYLHFLAAGGGVEPVFGLFFFLSSLGFITMSIQHTLSILVLNTLFLIVSSILLFGANVWVSEVLRILTNWFVFMCILIALASALFSHWLYRNLYAMQFMLNDKNLILKQTFKTLKATEDQLIHQQKQQALNHMANGLLHEIINPVNTSTQALGFAKSLNQDEDIAEALEEAISQQLRIADIVSELRDFARPQESHPVELINLFRLVEKAIKFCHRELQLEDIEVQLQINPEQMIYCHSTAMIQVFVNLLLNSCAALKQKQFEQNTVPVISIACSEQLLEKTLDIHLTDNGVGIESAQIKRLTEPFYTDQASPENIGLGLSICQTIMRHHNGSIDIYSEFGQWTKTTLTLPITSSL